jgi:hypothetical protein
MIRFLRQNAEIITSICVVLSLLIGGTFLYMSQQAQQAGQDELDAIINTEPQKAMPKAVQAPVTADTAASTNEATDAPVTTSESPTP